MGYYDGVCDECGQTAKLVTPMTALCFKCYDDVNPEEDPVDDEHDPEDWYYYQTDQPPTVKRITQKGYENVKRYGV